MAAQIALIAYFEACVLLPLGSWNDQPGNVPASGGNLMMGAAIGAAQLLLLLGTVWRVRPLIWLGLVSDTVWLLLHIQSLWLPYVRDASPQYASMYSRVFGRTTKLLPNFGITWRPMRCT